MSVDLVLGLASALVASVLFDLGVALQALEARRTSTDHALRPSLLARLARSRRWLAGTLLVLAGYPFHLVALVLAPLTAVQPVLAVGLLLLLVLGDRMLGESVGVREVVAVVAIVVGVGGIAWAAPGHVSTHSGPDRVAPVLGVIGAVALAPYLLRRRTGASLLVPIAAGCSFAFTGLASKLIADFLQGGLWGLVVLWLAFTGVLAFAGLLSEMSVLQRRAATRVVPIVFVFQICVPVLMAPVLGGESWAHTPLGGFVVVAFLAVVAFGAWLLGSAPGVSGIVAASHGGEAEPEAAKVPAAP